MSDQPMPLASSSSAASRQLPINLFTRSATDAIPQSTYFIPASWRRFQLSELINKVLSNTPENGKKPVPFDFLVNGEVLRGSLDSWVKKNRGNDEESQIDVEYVRSVMPPEEVGRVEVEDWVSGLSLGRKGYVLLSSYLSHVQVLPLSSASTSSPDALYTLPLPTSLGATSCTWISPQSQTEDILLAAGGIDRQVHVFTIPSLSPDSISPPRELYSLHGHTAPISSIIGSSTGRELISASWDGNLNFYVLPNEEPTEHQIAAEPMSYLPGQGNKKRRKLEKDNEKLPIEGLTDGDSTGVGGWRRVPDGVLRGHQGRVGGLVWDKLDSGKVWSAGWDGSVRGWEVETGAAGVLRQGPADKAALCVDQFQANGTLATGNMDRTICLWDTRQATSLISLTLPTSSPIPSITCHPTSSYTLASASYSGVVQIWDIRSPKNALFSVSKAQSKAAEETRKVTKNGKVLGERLLAMDWDGEVLVAGGEDGEVGIWRARGE
ncbi:ribosome biogenesis protein YTM1 [Kwoniella shandongensis]|uniref:Ribosome biogenesis protein YTM1 n=1 Tax=Kwoniella shandongensis TaxID=1734106 RepID=A0A5M6BRV1_9TREE|nr:ribosome biogenesis protein YTM1 [Kwoniella shandongensis]KAA5525628.1 ribosome biogenesis protein YTM1 [Kwoniella shandongensis]